MEDSSEAACVTSSLRGEEAAQRADAPATERHAHSASRRMFSESS